ncbi:MAG: histidine kinase [Actinomycetota bacterium]|nr:histidine kinase [Actinomycetota bacterium]
MGDNGGPATTSPGDSSIARPVLAFLLAGLLATGVIAALAVGAQRHFAVEEAIAGARQVTVVIGRDVLAPHLTDQALAGPGPAQDQLDDFVQAHVLSPVLVRVKIWAGDGTILYSDRRALVGQRFDLGYRERTSLRDGQVVAELSNLQAPENVGERQFGKLLEVYLGTRTASGRPVLFETYQRYDAIASGSRRTLSRFLPALLGGLTLLFLLQIPLAVSLARRLRAGQRRQADLLQRALDASDTARRRIAADLHDGMVQSLAGVSFSLSATAGRVAAAGLTEEAANTRGLAADLRQSVRELRTMVLNLAPPRLHEAGLQAALEDLVSTLTASGVDVDVFVADGPPLPPGQEELVFRVAQEAVRNIARHASAHTVRVRLDRVGPRLRLTVTDDGCGFAAETRIRRRAEGHLGLDLLAELASAAGAALRVTSAAGTGTEVLLEVTS